MAEGDPLSEDVDTTATRGMMETSLQLLGTSGEHLGGQQGGHDGK